jgi:hypothetical protein
MDFAGGFGLFRLSKLCYSRSGSPTPALDCAGNDHQLKADRETAADYHSRQGATMRLGPIDLISAIYAGVTLSVGPSYNVGHQRAPLTPEQQRKRHLAKSAKAVKAAQRKRAKVKSKKAARKASRAA